MNWTWAAHLEAIVPVRDAGHLYHKCRCEICAKALQTDKEYGKHERVYLEMLDKYGWDLEDKT